MNNINYKSDFDFLMRLYSCTTAADGSHERVYIGWPTWDWVAKFWTSTKANNVVASCVGGVMTNCYRDGDAIHIYCDNPRIGRGQLHVEFHALLPDKCYPDNTKDTYMSQALEVELVDGNPCCPSHAEVEVMLPFAVISAYDTARAAGFEGTAEEYYAGLAALPALSATVSDLAAAKAEVAAALRLHGVEAAAGDSLHDMAAKVAALRLAVPGEPGVVAHDWHGVPVPDLLNILRNNRRPDEYPYSWAVRTADTTVRLRGADAYLCSDGHFTTEQDTAHTFDDYAAGERWIVYYHRDRRYTVAPTAGYVTEICVLSGTPGYAVVDNTAEGCVAVGPLRSYTADLPPAGEATPLTVTSAGLTDIYLRRAPPRRRRRVPERRIGRRHPPRPRGVRRHGHSQLQPHTAALQPAVAAKICRARLAAESLCKYTDDRPGLPGAGGVSLRYVCRPCLPYVSALYGHTARAAHYDRPRLAIPRVRQCRQAVDYRGAGTHRACRGHNRHDDAV